LHLITQPVRKNNFDLLRLLLALVVIFSHSYVIFYGTNKDIEPYMRINNNTSDFGSVAVNWFFIISGFLITGSFKNSSSLKDYFAKRVLRIVPGFTVAFLLSIFLFGPLGSLKAGDVFESIKNYFSHVGLKINPIRLATLQAPKAGAGFEGTPLPKLLNAPLWTIQFEFICYLFVPVMAFMKIYKIKWVSVLLFVFAFTLMLFQKFGNFFPENPNYKSTFFGDPYY
jgi:peptidoglycan/LPS O-acetylase OafA/YrhL